MDILTTLSGIVFAICGTFLISLKPDYHLVRRGMDLDYLWKKQVESYFPRVEQIAKKEQSNLWFGLGLVILGGILSILGYIY